MRQGMCKVNDDYFALNFLFVYKYCKKKLKLMLKYMSNMLNQQMSICMFMNFTLLAYTKLDKLTSVMGICKI